MGLIINMRIDNIIGKDHYYILLNSRKVECDVNFREHNNRKSSETNDGVQHEFHVHNIMTNNNIILYSKE